MLKLYEVFSAPSPEPMPGREKLACLEVTGNTEAERMQILVDLKTLYGADCQYVDHDCGHDSGTAFCTMEVI